MSTSQVLDYSAKTPRPSDSNAESAPSFSALVAQHTIDLPGTQWLSRVSLTVPRENVQCLSAGHRVVKRAFDVVMSLTLLVATAPILLIAASLVKLTSPGPMTVSYTHLTLPTKRIV